VELIGIILAVWILDRLIKERDERQWLALRAQILVQLFQLIEEFLRVILPRTLYQSKPEGYEFYGKPFVSFLSVDDFNPFDLSEHLRKSSLNPKHHAEESRKIARQMRYDVQRIIGSPLPILDPELLAMLLDFEKSIMAFADLEESWGEAGGMSAKVFTSTCEAILIHRWLKQRAVKGKDPKYTIVE
jgi:hypothetical protein